MHCNIGDPADPVSAGSPGCPSSLEASSPPGGPFGSIGLLHHPPIVRLLHPKFRMDLQQSLQEALWVVGLIGPTDPYLTDGGVSDLQLLAVVSIE